MDKLCMRFGHVTDDSEFSFHANIAQVLSERRQPLTFDNM
jgi:hypothetical protein